MEIKIEKALEYVWALLDECRTLADVKRIVNDASNIFADSYNEYMTLSLYLDAVFMGEV